MAYTFNHIEGISIKLHVCFFHYLSNASICTFIGHVMGQRDRNLVSFLVVSDFGTVKPVPLSQEGS